MLLIFALGAVFGALLGMFALALITTGSDYIQRDNPDPCHRNVPAPDRQPGRHSTLEDGRRWQTRGR